MQPINWFNFLVCVLMLAACSACVTQPVPPSELVRSLNAPEFAVISSTDVADEVLMLVTEARIKIEARFVDAQRECHKKFLVNSCLIDAKEQRRADLAQVKNAEVSANYVKRKTRVEDMDRELERKRLAHPLPEDSKDSKK